MHGLQTRATAIRAQGKGKVFRQDQPQDRGAVDLPVWDDALPQRLLYELCDRGRATAALFGAPGLAALEQKAAEIHRTATDGLENGTLIADVEQTTWDAAETLAWLQSSQEVATLPHREADAMVPDRGNTKGAAFWLLEDGNLVRCHEYDSVAMRRNIAEGREMQGQLINADRQLPQACVRLAEAAVDYVWTVQGRSVVRQTTPL